jgi:hypothetical protein
MKRLVGLNRFEWLAPVSTKTVIGLMPWWEAQLRLLYEGTLLKQACQVEFHLAQGAFKNSMVRGIMQITLHFAIRCVLHRCESLEIRC